MLSGAVPTARLFMLPSCMICALALQVAAAATRAAARKAIRIVIVFLPTTRPGIDRTPRKPGPRIRLLSYEDCTRQFCVLDVDFLAVLCLEGAQIPKRATSLPSGPATAPAGA